MANIADIAHRIKSIEDTHQITKAMELISVSKMRKSIDLYENNLVYFKKVRQTIKEILLHSHDVHHPYLEHREGKRTAYLVIAADKSLAAGYNKNVLEMAWEHMQSRQERYVFTIGQMASDFFQKKKQIIDVEYVHSVQDPKLFNARSIALDIINLYESNLLDEVLVVFTKMESRIRQKPMIIKLLPVELNDLMDIELGYEYENELTYDPSPNAVLDVLVPQYVIGLLYGLLVQSVASEHCMRMLAMGNANKNADKMLETLKLDYNRARQAQITSSLTEIVAAANNLKS